MSTSADPAPSKKEPPTRQLLAEMLLDAAHGAAIANRVPELIFSKLLVGHGEMGPCGTPIPPKRPEFTP